MSQQKVTHDELTQLYSIVDLCFYAMSYERLSVIQRAKLTKLHPSTLNRLRRRQSKYIRFVTIQKLLKAANLTLQDVGGHNL